MISLTPDMLAAIPADVAALWERAERRRRRILFAGSPTRHMVRTGQHRRPRAGSTPGGLRRRPWLVKGAGA
jgi:hypothetical protein